MINYGMPYKGSKSRIVAWLVDVLPDAETFVDLFGGGGAVTHYAATSHKYNHVIYNDINPVVYAGFDMAIHNKFEHETRWIGREEFFKLKDIDPYVAICFSFGNDLKTYCYSQDIEAHQRALHELIFYQQTKDIWKYAEDKNSLELITHIQSRRNRRLVCNGTSGLGRLVSLERLERLQELWGLCFKNITTYNLDFADVPIPPNSVVYCDIPYKGTNTYTNIFDYERFYRWALDCPYYVFISEYDMPEQFYEVDLISHKSTLAAICQKATKEKLFCNKPYDANKQLSLF